MRISACLGKMNLHVKMWFFLSPIAFEKHVFFYNMPLDLCKEDHFKWHE